MQGKKPWTDSNRRKRRSSSPVLADHRRRGKILIPPLVDAFGPFKEVPWVRTVLPEVLWLALVHGHVGYRRGVEVVTTTARAARSVTASRRLFGAISTFSELSPSEWITLKGCLLAAGELFIIQEAIRPLVAYYPACPLKDFYDVPPIDLAPADLLLLKDRVESMYDRAESDPMKAQATFIWLAFDAGMLKVTREMSLANFPEIEHYPKTELSRQIGASVRSSINMFFGNDFHYSPAYHWPEYFWNRGLEIDSCSDVNV